MKEYKVCRILATTHKKLRVMAANREVTILELISYLIDAEVKRDAEK